MTSVTCSVATSSTNAAENSLITEFMEFTPGVEVGQARTTDSLLVENGYRLTALDSTDLTDLLVLQDEVMTSLINKPWLRANTADMLAHCLAEHTSVGIRFGDSLVAAAVLYDGHTSKESIRGYFTKDETLMASSINLKLVLASSAHRGMGLGRKLVETLNQQAFLMAKNEIACTIHPDNIPSQSLFSRLGYEHVGDVDSSYGERKVFARSLT